MARVALAAGPEAKNGERLEPAGDGVAAGVAAGVAVVGAVVGAASLEGGPAASAEDRGLLKGRWALGRL